MIKFSYILFILIAVHGFGQQSNDESVSFQIEMGYIFLNNDFNQSDYLETSDAFVNKTNLKGGLLKLSKETNISFLDVHVGSVFLSGDKYLSEYQSGIGGTYLSDYRINGGGVYFGLSPKWKRKNYGLTSEFSVGTFSFKEHITYFDDRDDPTIDILVEKSSYGLGGMAAVGFYVKVGRFSLNPSVNANYSGGANASFLFYGYSIPLTVQLTK